MTILNLLEKELQEFNPIYLEVIDESHMHSRGEESHFKIIICSNSFQHLSSVKRHQLIYKKIPQIMNKIHALAIHTFTPEEWDKNKIVSKSPSCLGGSKSDKI